MTIKKNRKLLAKQQQSYNQQAGEGAISCITTACTAPAVGSPITSIVDSLLEVLFCFRFNIVVLVRVPGTPRRISLCRLLLLLLLLEEGAPKLGRGRGSRVEVDIITIRLTLLRLRLCRFCCLRGL